MVKNIQFNISFSNRALYTLIAAVIIIIAGIGVYAYNSAYNNPAVFGHSANEIEEADPTVPDSVKDGVDWSEITGIPAGFADGIDDAGGSGGGSLGFGEWERKSADTVYQAATDGFVLSYTPSCPYCAYDIYGYTDSNNPPTTLRARHKTSAVYAEDPSQFIMMPVREGDYWKVTGSPEVVYWIPLIGGGSTSQQFKQDDCYRISYTIPEVRCKVGYYVAGSWDDGGGYQGDNGMICCR